jgi:hypothetical protein
MERSMIMEHFTINAPGLTYVSFHTINWSPHHPHLPVSRLKTFFNYDLDQVTKVGFPHLASHCIPPSSFDTLTELIIGLHSLELPNGSELGVIRIPRLLRILITLRQPLDVWKLFVRIEAPALEEVNLTSEYYCRSSGGIPTEPVNKDLSHLSKLSMHMPVCWLLPILILCHHQISMIVVETRMEDEDASHITLRSALPTPIQFDNLKNLDLMFLFEGRPDENEAHYNWFMSVFDFTRAANHVKLYLGNFSGSRTVFRDKPLIFPYVEKLTLFEMDELDIPVAPSLHHLSCVFGWGENTSRSAEDCRLSTSSVKSLRLTIPGRTPPDASFFTPFRKVQVLILILPYRWKVSAEKFFAWVNTRDTDGNIYLPELRTFHLIFMGNYWAGKDKLMLDQLRLTHEFLTERRKQGSPLDTLLFTHKVTGTGVTPSFLRRVEAEDFWTCKIRVEVVEDPDDFVWGLPSV